MKGENKGSLPFVPFSSAYLGMNAPDVNTNLAPPFSFDLVRRHATSVAVANTMIGMTKLINKYIKLLLCRVGDGINFRYYDWVDDLVGVRFSFLKN